MRIDGSRVRTDNFELNADQGRRCRRCGCTDLNACPGGCSWVESDLCSACAGRAVARDPSQNPQPGDVLAKGDDMREVWDRVGDRIEHGFPGKSATRWLSLIQWRAWARTAEVRKVAP